MDEKKVFQLAPKAEPDPEIIKALRVALQKALAGEVLGIAMQVALEPANNPTVWTSIQPSRAGSSKLMQAMSQHLFNLQMEHYQSAVLGIPDEPEPGDDA